MLARIVGSEQSVLLDIDVDIEWTASIAGRMPNLTFTVPRGSPAWGHEILDERGGFLIVIDSPLGRFRAIADKPSDRASGMVFKGIAPHQWLDKQPSPTGVTLRSVLAGHVILMLFREGVLANPPFFGVGSIVMAPPLIPEIRFNGQSIADVLDEMRERTGHEWWIDNDFIFHWGPFEGRFREQWIVDDGVILSETDYGSLLDEYAKYTEVEPDGGTFTAIDGTVPVLWPTRKVTRL